ncbi:mCG145078, partial [Mus musculus]
SQGLFGTSCVSWLANNEPEEAPTWESTYQHFGETQACSAPTLLCISVSQPHWSRPCGPACLKTELVHVSMEQRRASR